MPRASWSAVKQVAMDVLEELAASQYGAFSELQAFYENVGKDMLRHHARPGGRWRRVVRGVYEVVDQPWEWRRPLMVAQLALGPAAVLSHRSAAAILGLDGI